MRYHGDKVSSSIKYKIITCISKSKTKIKQYSLSIIVDNQKRKLIRRAPTKAQFILHELIPQISLFWNYENHIHAYLKSRETKEIFENQRKGNKIF